MRGQVETPAFMPVGTQASVKTLTPDEVRAAGAQIVLANTYHLMLRPGADLIEELGGVSHFMRWEGPVLTDSGGFQVFSLAQNRSIRDEGVSFRSHIDGREYHLSPEESIQLQRQFGSDVVMALDVCVGYDAPPEEQRAATEQTHRWLPRNIQAFQRSINDEWQRRPLLFSICQGGFDATARRESAAIIAQANVDGCAIGGLSVGEPKPVMAEMLAASVSELPVDKPRYLMGVGSPEDLWNAVSVGIDMFDCVLPTRVARHGGIYTADGRLNIKAARFRRQDVPLEEGCDCYTCQTFSRAYVHHLFRVREMLGQRLATIHNLRFLFRQMDEMRSAIDAGTFAEAHHDFLNRYEPVDQRISEEQRSRYQAGSSRR